MYKDDLELLRSKSAKEVEFRLPGKQMKSKPNDISGREIWKPNS
jgi:hypothetical protein